MFICKFWKAASFRPKSYYPAINEIFATLPLSFLSDSHKTRTLPDSICTLGLTEVSLDLSQRPVALQLPLF